VCVKQTKKNAAILEVRNANFGTYFNDLGYSGEISNKESIEWNVQSIAH